MLNFNFTRPASLLRDRIPKLIFKPDLGIFSLYSAYFSNFPTCFSVRETLSYLSENSTYQREIL